MTTPATGGPQEGAPSSQQEGQEPPAEGQQQTPPTEGQGGGQEPQTGTPGQVDLDAITDPTVRSYVEAQIRDAAEARREAARYRSQAREFQGKVTEYERANETAEQAAERERTELQQERDRLHQEITDLKVGGAVRAAAGAAQAFDADLVYSLVKDQVETGEDGVPTNTAALMQALKRDKPYLFRRTDAGAGAGQQDAGGGQTPPAVGVNEFIRGRVTASR